MFQCNSKLCELIPPIGQEKGELCTTRKIIPKPRVIRLKRGRDMGPERVFTRLFENIKTMVCKTVEDMEFEIAFLTSCSHRELRRFPDTVRLKGFPNGAIKTITAKGLLAQRLMKLKRTNPKIFNFFPTSFILPRESTKLADFAEKNKDIVFISKPAFAAGGRGINIRGKVSELLMSKGARVVQRYITNPLLVNGYKFDLRIYVFVKSFDPFTIYVHEEGLVRFCSEPYPKNASYKCSGERMKSFNILAHLTNWKVNRNSLKSKSKESASKWRLSKFWNFIAESGLSEAVRKDIVWDEIKRIIWACFDLVRDDVRHQQCLLLPQDQHCEMCWDLFGIDIMLDEKGRV